MFLMPHQWTLVPQTAYEIRRELRVRESRHTTMLFDKKYYDPESGKYITDKLKTINSYDLADIIDDCEHTRTYSELRYRHRNNVVYEDDYSPIYRIPKFVPKDDDFDEEEVKVVEVENKVETKPSYWIKPDNVTFSINTNPVKEIPQNMFFDECEQYNKEFNNKISSRTL